MRLRIGSVFVPVTDLERSIEWYQDCLGLKFIDKWPNGEGAGFGGFASGPTGLALVKVESKQPTEFMISAERTNVYFNFEPDDIYEMHERLKSKGAKVTEVKESGWLIGFEFFDPDGNAFSAVVDKPESPFYLPFGNA